MAEQAGRQYAAFTQLPPMAGLPGGTSQSSIDLPCPGLSFIWDTYPDAVNGLRLCGIIRVVQIAPQVSHDIDDLVKLDPQFTQTLQVERRQKLGMDTPQIKEFLSKTSLMSLGSYCAVANSFEALGLREDFLDWDGTSHKVGGLDVFPMRWGGSFWHHDITDVKVRQTFMRRKERFLNAQNENLLFIRVVNGTQELMQITGLYSALQERFGDKSRVRLLVLIDLQDTEQEVITQDLGRDVIFSCVHHSSWESHIPAPTPEEQARLRLHKASDSYSAALVRALYIWASVGSFVTWPSLASFSQRVVQWVGPDPKRDSFQPSRLSLAPVAATATMLTLNAAMAQPFTQMTQPLTQPLTQPYYFVRPTVNRKERKELLKVAAQIPADNTATLHFQQSGAVTATEKLQLSMTGFDIYQKAYEHVMQKDRAFSIKVEGPDSTASLSKQIDEATYHMSLESLGLKGGCSYNVVISSY
ncbi:Hypothetical protein SCF082_LOCUS45074 [Durusdinium trenchii]|uniref:Uncharacterized protein n=1 Tax=Durusdinium trenchii TaxID=1381693 RepID=A0ABP0R5X7_9DINO